MDELMNMMASRTKGKRYDRVKVSILVPSPKGDPTLSVATVLKKLEGEKIISIECESNTYIDEEKKKLD